MTKDQLLKFIELRNDSEVINYLDIVHHARDAGFDLDELGESIKMSDYVHCWNTKHGTLIEENGVFSLRSLKDNLMTKVEMHVLYFFGYKEGTEGAGSFTVSLIDAIMRADTDNMRKLYLGFPEYVDAVKSYQTGSNMAGEKVDIFANYKGEENTL